MKSSTPASAAMAAAVSGLSPVIMTVRMPMARKREALLDAALDDVLELDHAEDFVGPRRPPGACRPGARCSTISASTSGGSGLADKLAARHPAAPLRYRSPSISTPLMRVWAVKGTNGACGFGRSRPRRPNCLASTTMLRPSGVSSARDASCAASASSFASTPGAGMNSDRHAVAEGDGAGLVQQQHVHVSRGLDRAAAHGQDVVLHQPVDAGDADGAQQPADGGGNQADQQRDQHRHGEATLPE